MLGFLDDVFDIRWRYKLPIPVIASVPLLVVYYAGVGGTHVVVPSFARGWIGAELVDLGTYACVAENKKGGVADLCLLSSQKGPLYYLYMSLLSTFCTNSINILAGINGVETGQALIIALSLCANDALYLDAHAGQGGSRSSIELVQRHLFSLYLMLPFVGTCIGLLWWNW